VQAIENYKSNDLQQRQHDFLEKNLAYQPQTNPPTPKSPSTRKKNFRKGKDILEYDDLEILVEENKEEILFEQKSNEVHF
jgi:hypothetical protein